VPTVGGLWNGSYLAGKAASGIGMASGAVSKIGSTTAHLALIAAKGTRDALYNANTIGFYDAFGGNHLSSYDDDYEKAAYLRGRLAGDAIASAQSAHEINIGGGTALATGFETVGVGAAAGGALATHGLGMGVTATADAAWTLKQLYKLHINSTAAGDIGRSSTSSQSGGNKANKGTDAKTSTEFTKSSLQLGQQMHKAYKAGLADKVNTFKEFVLPSGKRIDFLDVKNGIIYELKPNNPRAILQGQKQLQMYMQELQGMPKYQGIQWKTVLDTY
jgi:hypothetical protein